MSLHIDLHVYDDEADEIVGPRHARPDNKSRRAFVVRLLIQWLTAAIVGLVTDQLLAVLVVCIGGVFAVLAAAGFGWPTA